MKVLHISDLHYASDYSTRGGIYNVVLRNMSHPFTQLEELLAKTNSKYDVVVVTGDLGEEANVKEYQEVLEQLRKYFTCPIITTPGNHDNLVNYQEAYGSLYSTLIVGEYRFISFNTASSEDDNGILEDEMITKLDEILSDRKYKNILLTHHHLLASQFSMPEAKGADKLESIVDKYDIFAILTGHTHHAYETAYHGIPYYTTGSLSFAADIIDGELTFYEEPSMTEYEISDNKISSKLIKTDNPLKKLYIMKR